MIKQQFIARPRVPVRLGVLSLMLVGASSALALSGCSASTAPSSTDPSSTAPSSTNSALTSATYTSVSGHGEAGDVAWLGTEPLRVSFDTSDNKMRMSVQTPCNSLSAPVQVDDRLLTLDTQQMTSTLMGCAQTQSEYEAWTTAFLQTPLSYTLVEKQLTMSNATDQIVLRAD